MPPKPPKPTPAHSKHLTHFLCIPLVTPTSRPQLQTSLSRFRADLTSNVNTNTITNTTSQSSQLPSQSSQLSSSASLPPAGKIEPRPTIPPKAIRPVGTIHLTLGVMSLVTPEKVQRAVDVLRGLDLKGLLLRSSSSGSSSSTGSNNRRNGEKEESRAGARSELESDAAVVDELKVTLKGVSSMNDPTKTSVLYTAPVDHDGRLRRFCLGIRDIFMAADLMVADTRPLLLHATVLNTVYVPGVKRKGGPSARNGRGGGGGRKERLTLDARDILERYRDMEWMSGVRVEKVAICRMGARKVEGGEEGDEEYFVESEIEIP
ncbi:hypothetical protein B7463_g4392, partial [Scytalidium lignicola]